MRLGSDVDALEALARSLDESGAHLDRVRAILTDAAASVAWHGVDADRFRQQWHGELGPKSRRAADQLRAAATDARRQATQQRLASAPVTGAAGSGGTATGLVGGAAGLAITLPESPTRLRLATITVEGDDVMVIGGHLRYRIEDLPGGRSRIVEIRDLSIGAGADTGSTVTVGLGSTTVGVGTSAVAAVSGLVGGETSWVVDSDDVQSFLVARGIALAGGEGTAEAVSWAASIPGVGFLASQVGLGGAVDALAYDPPAPERIGGIAGVHIDGSADVAAAGSVSLAGVVSDDAMAGATFDTTDHSVTVRLSASLSASATAVLIPGAARSGTASVVGTLSLRFDRSGRPVELLAEETTTGTTVVRHLAAIDLTRPAVRGATERLVDALRSSGPADPAVSDALDDLVIAGIGSSIWRTDEYRVGATRNYGVELPGATAMVSYQDLALER